MSDGFFFKKNIYKKISRDFFSNVTIMSNKKKLIKKEVIEQEYESSSDDQIELPKKEIKKKPFVMTEKRKESVAKMLAARKEKINARKEIKQLEQEKIKKLKDDLKKKQEKKLIN